MRIKITVLNVDNSEFFSEFSMDRYVFTIISKIIPKSVNIF